jgi:serine/threonine-protein kinase
LDERTDIFSLGGILYKIISLKPPFQNNSTEALRQQVLTGQIQPPQRVAEGPVSPWLSNIAMKALNPDPDKRYQSAKEMQQDVAKFMRSGWHYPRRMIEPGTRIICEGEVGHEAYIILDGHCRVFKEMDGQRVTMREMGPGEVFGETAVLTGAPRSASVEATDRVMLAVLSRDLFEQEIGANFWMGQFMKTLADRFREMTERVSELERELEQHKNAEQEG